MYLLNLQNSADMTMFVTGDCFVYLLKTNILKSVRIYIH